MPVVAGYGDVSCAQGSNLRSIIKLVARSPPNANYTKHRMILGTHTSRTAQDYLMIAEVILPKPSPNEGDPLADYDQEKGGERNPAVLLCDLF
jgi:hypothetical protein